MVGAIVKHHSYRADLKLFFLEKIIVLKLNT